MRARTRPLSLTDECPPLVYVDGDLLPFYMGIKIEPRERDIIADLSDMLFPRERIARPQQFDTFLTKLVLKHGMPYRYIPICQLFNVQIRVEHQQRVLLFHA